MEEGSGFICMTLMSSLEVGRKGISAGHTAEGLERGKPEAAAVGALAGRASAELGAWLGGAVSGDVMLRFFLFFILVKLIRVTSVSKSHTGSGVEFCRALSVCRVTCSSPSVSCPSIAMCSRPPVPPPQSTTNH